jgi:hypothetical protein
VVQLHGGIHRGLRQRVQPVSGAAAACGLGLLDRHR